MQIQTGQRSNQKHIMLQKGQFHRAGNYYEPNQLGERIFERKTEVIIRRHWKREHWIPKDPQSHTQKRKFLLLWHTLAGLFYTLKPSRTWREAANAPGLQISSHPSEVLNPMDQKPGCSSTTDPHGSSGLTWAHPIPGSQQEKKAFSSHNTALHWKEKHNEA